jgi:hypothetical protein
MATTNSNRTSTTTPPASRNARPDSQDGDIAEPPPSGDPSDTGSGPK